MGGSFLVHVLELIWYRTDAGADGTTGEYRAKKVGAGRVRSGGWVRAPRWKRTRVSPEICIQKPETGHGGLFFQKKDCID